MIKKLDSLFSKYVRLRDTKGGKGKCITCPAELTYEEGTCGHFRKRRHMATRWLPDNGHLQCPECNTEDNDTKYEAALIEKIGKERVEEVIWLSRQDTKFTKGELRNLEKNLKELINGSRD